MLKYVRGEQLSADHWLDMFRLLKLPKGTTLEKLTFGDIIKVTDEIIGNAAEIKVINKLYGLCMELVILL